MWRSILASLFACLLFCGCGGSTPVPPPPVKDMPASIPPPTGASPSRSTAKRIGPRNKAKSEEPSEEPDEEFTSNHFHLATSGPGMLVVPPNEVPEQNLYSVIKPVIDNSLISVEPRVEEQRPDSRSGDLNLTLPPGFSQTTDSNLNERGFPDRILCEADGAEMVLIDGGVFTQGTNSGPTDSSPEHLAFVSPFYMDTTEVTLARYREFQTEIEVGELPQDASNNRDGPDYPALGIAWKDADKYAETRGKTLPSEAEWERAARGPQGNLYPWGKGRPPTLDNVFDTILPVASRPTDLTKTGLYDMAGNAREWTVDWYSASAYAASNGQVVRDSRGPKRPNKQAERVVKGSRDGWHLWVRGRANLRKSSADIGFRCVLRITEEMIISDENPAPSERPRSPTNPSSSPPRTNPGF